MLCHSFLKSKGKTLSFSRCAWQQEHNDSWKWLPQPYCSISTPSFALNSNSVSTCNPFTYKNTLADLKLEALKFHWILGLGYMRRASLLFMNKRNKKTKMGSLGVRKKVKLVNFSVQRNLSTLRRIIPGCDRADVDTLIMKSIEQILKLQLQVSVLKSLSNYFGI